MLERELVFEAPSPEDAFDLLVESAPPTHALWQRLDEAGRERLRAGFLDYFREFETPDGVREPRPYILILGRRR